MLLDRIGLKREAKTIVKNAKANAYGVTLLFLAIALVIGGIDTYVSDGIGQIFIEQGLSVPQWLPRAEFPPLVVTFVSVVVWLLTQLLSAGYCLYHLGIRQRREMSCGTLFDGFAFAGKVILVQLVSTIFIALWTLLFVIPGFIATYRYRFALYNICENPELGVMEAIRMSKRQTKGFKWQLFVMDLSFLGWSILCALTMGILNIWITPWIQQTEVGYFQAIKAYKNRDSRSSFGEDGEFHATGF